MQRKSCLVILLSLVVVLLVGANVLASENSIPGPKIERHPEIFTYEVEAPPIWPFVSRAGTVFMASFDLTSIDLTESEDLLREAMFDTRTKWPEKMPPAFDPVQVMEWGKNPGIGLRKLHQTGITGQGVGIAILDGHLLLEHEQWNGRVKMYEEINSYAPTASWHTTGVTSTVAGTTTGVAPKVDIYSISYNADKDEEGNYIESLSPLTRAIQRIIEVNKTLPEDNKIRVISLSTGWAPEETGYKELMNVIKEAGEEGIFVVSGNLFETHHMYFYGLDIDLFANRDDLSSFKIINWPNWIKKIGHSPNVIEYYEKQFVQEVGEDCQLLFIPCNKMTVAGSSSTDAYIYYVNNGWSHVIPYVGGLYILACQVKPDITPELFWNEALRTGEERILNKDGKQYIGKIINPAKLMESLASK